MKDQGIPATWQLDADPRYIKENMSRAMGMKIERALVELITNADDSYRNLEDTGKKVQGKIRIELNRKRKGKASVVSVKDRAEGMDKAELYRKVGRLGRRESGFEKGKARRGIHGRGARDAAAFGTIHFESIKDDRYNHLILPPSLQFEWENPGPIRATKQRRKKLGIAGAGTVVTIEVESRFKIPHHESLLRDLSRYYSLRDLFSKESREVVLVDLNQEREDRLRYVPPEGEVVFDDHFSVPDYPDSEVHMVVRRHETPFEREQLPYKEGILVASASGIHDCTHFDLESDPLAWRFTGRVTCDYIDNLVRDYDDRDESNPNDPGHPPNNPTRLLDPAREGLIGDHPFRKGLYGQCGEILLVVSPIIA
jgi:hypothetical protein